MGYIGKKIQLHIQNFPIHHHFLTQMINRPVKAEDCRFIASISPDDWKTRRGQLSVWAGDIGTAGAALLCARAA